MADICNRLAKSLSTRTCATSGGINRNSWTFQQDQFTGIETIDADSGALTGFGLKTGEKGIKGVGRVKKGSGSNKGTQADTGSTNIEQTLIQEYKYSGQVELNALTAFLKAQAKVTFQEMADGTIRVYFKAFGNETGTAEDGTGTLLTDESNVMKVTLVGNEPEFPMYFEAPLGTGGLSQLAANRAYLDALVTV